LRDTEPSSSEPSAPSGPSSVQAVAFDLDDTLYPERQYVRSGYRAVGEFLRERLGRTEAFEDWLWDRFRSGRSAGALDALNAEFALGRSEEQIEALVSVYRDHRPDIRPWEGAIEVLRRLGRRCRLALLSDGFLPAQRLKLEALALAPLFDVVVFTEEIGRDAWKPSAAGFQAVREGLGVPHERCAYVADNPAKDFVAPNRLGWRTVRLLCEGQVHAHEPAAPDGRPDITIRRLDELETALF
jgi:putative hydrolase of the HAD superfamily